MKAVKAGCVTNLYCRNSVIEDRYLLDVYLCILLRCSNIMSQEGEILKVGNLLKRSRNRTTIAALGGVNWQLRRISLTTNRLSYGNVDGPVKGWIPIDSSTSCSNCTIEGKDYAFRVVTGGDELVLNAANADDRKEWVEAIQLAPNYISLAACNVEAVMDVAAEMERVRQEKEREASEEVARLLGEKKNKETEIVEKRRKLEAELAEKKRKEAALLLIREAEAAAARAEVFKKVQAPAPCNKKLSHESSFNKRFISVNEEDGHFVFGKTAEEVMENRAKRVDLKLLVEEVKVDDSLDVANFRLLFKTGVEIPEAIVRKTVFKTTTDSLGLEITMEDRELCSNFVKAVGYVLKK